MDLLTPRQYAKHRGVTYHAVYKMIAAGRIPLLNPQGRQIKHRVKGKPVMIDPKQADAALLETQQRFDYQEEASSESVSEGFVGTGAARARAAREAVQARLLQIKLDERRGALTPKEASLLGAEESGRVIRRHVDSLLNYTEEIISAYESGGVAQSRKFFDARLKETQTAISRALMVRADEIESDAKSNEFS